jgi:hypothetical protein
MHKNRLSLQKVFQVLERISSTAIMILIWLINWSGTPRPSANRSVDSEHEQAMVTEAKKTQRTSFLVMVYSNGMDDIRIIGQKLDFLMAVILIIAGVVGAVHL